MSTPAALLEELLTLLRLEQIEARIFRGQSQDLGWGAVFGGQVLGQALSAAAQTVPPDRHAHSLHAYFLRQGDARKPIVYEVECIRDGTSFTTRRVVAVQKGRPIFLLSASFQIAEPGFDHYVPMTDAPPPESLISETEAARKLAPNLPEGVRRIALAERPIEMRAVQQVAYLNPQPTEPRRQIWYRAAGPLPDDDAVHRYLLAYASDFNFLSTTLQPHAASLLTSGLQVASLDHAMYFHRPFRFDDWLLYEVESPSASGARGLVTGRFYTRDGLLVATAVQEGLIRRREPAR